MNPTEQAMLGVIEETFASLAFMFPVESDSPADHDPQAAQHAMVEFSGPFRGDLRLSASEELLEPLATNMLGLEDGVCPSQEQKQDAFRELLNVICGNLLPMIASPREVFDVCEPRLLAAQDDGAPAAGLTDLGTIDVDLDAGHIRLALRVEEPLAGCDAGVSPACVADILSACAEGVSPACAADILSACAEGVSPASVVSSFRQQQQKQKQDAGGTPATHEGKMPSSHAERAQA
jgi:hypothetical protein